MNIADLIIYALVFTGVAAVVVNHLRGGSSCSSCPSNKNSFVKRYQKDQLKQKKHQI